MNQSQSRILETAFFSYYLTITTSLARARQILKVKILETQVHVFSFMSINLHFIQTHQLLRVLRYSFKRFDRTRVSFLKWKRHPFVMTCLCMTYFCHTIHYFRINAYLWDKYETFVISGMYLRPCELNIKLLNKFQSLVRTKH